MNTTSCNAQGTSSYWVGHSSFCRSPVALVLYHWIRVSEIVTVGCVTYNLVIRLPSRIVVFFSSRDVSESAGLFLKRKGRRMLTWPEYTPYESMIEQLMWSRDFDTCISQSAVADPDRFLASHFTVTGYQIRSHSYRIFGSVQVS